ncbi:hypothetical protein C8F01DRAFT_1227129 [Mycena amicta]|nr:hypothetical protein C8F01DRAFT_1227129 [Mycena amicta]
MSTPPAKRQRTDSEVDLTRCSDFWFDDGNIIIQVENTQFRVNIGVVSMHSAVFRDMFTIPLPADEPLLEGCPVVVLSGDSAEDWVHLLQAIYPRTISDIPTIQFISSVLRLSKKYDIPLLRHDCIRRLKTEFPTTLKAWDALEPGKLIKNLRTYFLVASLARETGLYSILPTVYYRITVSENWTVPEVLQHQHDTDLFDRFVCAQGHVKLRYVQAHTTMSWINPHEANKLQANCARSNKCTSVLQKMRDLELCDENSFIHGLERWDTEWDEAGLCSNCRSKARSLFKDGRKDMWKVLPSVFGLPDWQELLKMDIE